MRLARSEKRALRASFSSCFGPRFRAPRWDATRGVTLLRPVAFGCSFCPNWIREREKEERRGGGGGGNRVIPLQSTRFCSYVQFFFFFAAPFVSLSFFFLRFFSFSVSFDSEMNWKAEREANEQQPLRGSCYPRSIGVYSLGVPLQTRFTYPRYIYIYILYFRRCFAFVFHRTMKETLRTICSLYFSSSNRRGKNFHLRA